MPSDDQDFTFYFGAASGSARKALRQLEEPNVMISYATENNEPWDCAQLFIDSGGYSLMINEGEHPHHDEYLDYIERVEPDYFALQDFPCEPDVLEKYGRSVQQHREMTIEWSAAVLQGARDRGIEAEPVTVIQGWEPHQYLRAIERHRELGVLTDCVGIGSVCRRNAETDISEVVHTVREALPNRKLHAFGVKRDVLSRPGVLRALDSADSLAYDWSYERDMEGPWWHQVAYNYLEFKEGLYDALGREEPRDTDPGPNSTLTQATTAADGGGGGGG